MEASRCKAAVVKSGVARGERGERRRVEGGRGWDWVRLKVQAATEGLDEGETRA